MRAFEGIRIPDCSHVLAGPLAAFKFARGDPSMEYPLRGSANILTKCLRPPATCR